MSDAATRAGAAAIARASHVDVPAGASTAPASGRGVVIPGRDERIRLNETRGAVFLPDEALARVLRFVLEGDTNNDGAHARWSVGGRFRVPAPDAARRRSNDRLADADGRVENVFDDARGAAKRGRLRLVSKQWRRVLDRTCFEVEVRKAVVFNDDALAGLAAALRVGDGDEDVDEDVDVAADAAAAATPSTPRRPAPARRLVLEGSHLCDGAFRLTTRGISAFAAALPSLAALHVERTGMDVAEVLRVAAACPNLAELVVDGGARETKWLHGELKAPLKAPLSRESGALSSFPATNTSAPFESALLHDMPCASAYAAMDALAALFRDGAARLRTVAVRRAPGVFAEERAALSRRGTPVRRACAPEDAAGMCAALVGCASLRSLALEEVGASDAVGARIARSLPARLEAFSISGDDIGVRAGAALAAGLAGDSPRNDDVSDAFPTLAFVRVPRRAAFGAVAAEALDRALSRRASATAARDARGERSDPERPGLFVRVFAETRSGSGSGSRATAREARERERHAFSKRVLARWKVRDERRDAGDFGFDARTGGWCLSSSARSHAASHEKEEACERTRTARETLRYLAAREDFESVFPSSCPDTKALCRTPLSPRLVWATTCPGAPYDALRNARDWLKRRPRDDSLAATAARVAARERFSRLAAALEGEGSPSFGTPSFGTESGTESGTVRVFSRDATGRTGRTGHPSEASASSGTRTRGPSVSARDAAAFGAVANAVERDAVAILTDDDAAAFAEDADFSRDDAETYASETLSKTFPEKDERDHALRRALACVALPAALARAAAEDDTASGRDVTGASPVPSLPPVVVDLVHDELCALLVAEDLVKRDAEAKGARRSEGTVSRDETRANTPPLVDEALFFGGSAWAALEATSRLLAPTDLDAKFETTSREFCKNAADFLQTDALPRWIDAGVAGSPEDAALAADVVASALLRLAGHESVSLGARGLRALAKILGKAAALVPEKAFSFGDVAAGRHRTKRPPPTKRSWRRLHDAARAVFAAREFAPLLRGNFGRGETDTRAVTNATSANASSRVSSRSEDPEEPLRSPSSLKSIENRSNRSAPRHIVSWPQWLNAVGAPPPLDAAAAANAAETLRAKSDAYERMEAEAASLRARMSRVASDLRRVALDVRTSHGFHREPARELLLRAHRAVGWRAATSGEREPELGASGLVASRRPRQTSLAEAWSVRNAVREWPVASRASLRVSQSPLSAAPTWPAVHRVPRAGWREDALAALDALFAHAARAAPFVPNAGTPQPGWSLVNDAEDATSVFSYAWERRACAATLAWYVDARSSPSSDRSRTADDSSAERHEKPTSWSDTNDKRARLDDVLRVLGAVNASDEGSVSSDGARERFPVDAMARLRREGSVGHDGANDGSRMNASFATVVELDARLRWNLMLDA